MLPKDITNTAKEYILALHLSFGPLKRTVLGDWSVQGIDFVYTLQGWIKGVNGDGVGKDVGEDGIGASPLLTAKDAMSYALGYFENDYKPVGLSGANLPFSGQSALTGVRNLYNGNISSMVTALQGLPTLGSVYKYDQLNRIKSADYQKFDAASNTWTNENNYGNSYTYDANGNILNLQRKSPNGQSGNEMDNLTYHYQPGTNKLTHVSDLVPDSEFTMDIDDQQEENYQYDEIGNLVTDQAEGLQMEWTPSGKLSRVVNSKKHNELNFGYDGMGNRYKKQVSTTLDPNDPNSSKDTKTEYYVRDASGNVMAIYQLENDFRVDESILQGVFATILQKGQSPEFIQQHLLSNPVFAKQFLPSLSNSCDQFIRSKDLEYFLTLEPTLVRLLVQSAFPAPHANWIDGLVTHSPLLIPQTMIECRQGRSLLRVLSQEDFLVWLAKKLKDFDTTLSSPFMALVLRLADLYGSKDPNINYYNYLKDIITLPNMSYNNLLDVLVDEYRIHGNTWINIYFTEYFASNILSTLKIGNLLQPHVADALANCGSVSDLVAYFISAYRTVTYADLPITKTLLDQVAFSTPSEQLAWVRYCVNANSYSMQMMLSDIFFRTNMSITQLLLNIKNSFDNDTYQNVLQQLQPMQELREVLRYRLSEQSIYGSTRLGVRNLERNAVFANYLFEKKHQLAEPEDPMHPLLVAPAKPQGDLSNPLIPQPEYSLTLGYKQYELTNHLGNVQVTLSDRKLGLVQNENSAFSSYTADVLSAVDYYPFGMAMPGRSGDGGYRYGFNTQEKVDEISWGGNHTTAMYWEYDTRLGRRWNLDPIYNTDISRYAVNGNNPIYYLDPNGDFKTKFGAKVYNFLHGGKGEIKKATGGQNKGEWFVEKQVEYKGEGAGVAYERKFGWDKGNPANAIDDAADGVNKGIDFAKRNASDAWNSPLARYFIPDFYTFSGSFQTSSGIYINEELTFTLMLRGKDPGLYFNTTTGFGVVTSVGVDVGCSVGKGYYYGSNPRELSSSMLGGWQGSLSTAFGARGTVVQVGGTAGVDVGLNDKNEISTVTTKVGISAGVGVGTPVLQGGIGAGKATNAIPILKF